MGCNAGTCHGSKDGKNGFKLSLRGYDPLYDHRALTDDIGAPPLQPRGSRPEPDAAQGDRLDPARRRRADRTSDHPYYDLVRDWIVAGRQARPESPARRPRSKSSRSIPIVPLPGMKQQVTVMATYTDGQVRDVTREAFIESGNIEVIEANTTRRADHAPPRRGAGARPLRRGLRRHHDHRAWATAPASPGSSSRSYNYIDELVDKKLQAVKIAAERPVHRRRVRPPRLSRPDRPAADRRRRSRAFLADPRDSRAKRDALVDQLVGSREYVEHWTNKWADLLQVNRKFLGEEGSIALRNWIKDARRQQQAVRPVRPRDAHRQRLEPREPAGRVLEDHPRPGIADGEHDAPVPGRALQLQQVPRPSVRALDAGPVLPAARVLRPGRPQGRPDVRRAEDRRHARSKGPCRWSR